MELQNADTAQSLHNLANLYYQQGKYVDAEPLFQRALTIREQQSGIDHPDTTSTLNSLAELYRNRANMRRQSLYIGVL